MSHAIQDDWDQHWERYAESYSNNPAQRYRRRLLLSWLDLKDSPARVLDIGSGHGDFLTAVKARHPRAQLLGIELSRSGVDIARRKVPGAAFYQANLAGPIQVDAGVHGWATHAVCSEVLEHLDDPRGALGRASTLMAPGCRLVVTVPGGPMSAFDKHIGHRTHYTPATLRRLLEEAGFTVEFAGAAGYPFFNLYRLVVILRGKKLIEDVAVDGGRKTTSLLALAVMKCFDLAFLFNLSRFALGWQMVAVARYPG